ncbi:C4-type zinc ribbon domain-containing protein [Rarobacter faecitabidus]
MADQQALLGVQALDTRAQQLFHRRRTLPVHKQIAALDAQLAELERSLVAARTEVSDSRAALTKAEADVAQVRDRSARDQGLLDGGAVTPKDAQALLSEIESLAARQAKLEEIELEAMETLEGHEAVLAELEQQRSALDAERVAAVAVRDQEVAEIDAERKQVAVDRRGAIEGIDASLMIEYEKLRDQLGGLGAARLEGRMCSGCRIQLGPVDLSHINAAAPDAVVHCEECGRILVRPLDS